MSCQRKLTFNPSQYNYVTGSDGAELGSKSVFISIYQWLNHLGIFSAETTAYTYNAVGNQLTITRPDASVTTNEYHLRNNQLKKTSGSQTYPVGRSEEGDPKGSNF